MNTSFKKDVQPLMNIIKYQHKIRETMQVFKCNQCNLDSNLMAFDLCAFYMGQINVNLKSLTDETREALKELDVPSELEFENTMSQTYDTINRKELKVYVFKVASFQMEEKIKDRIQYCFKNR